MMLVYSYALVMCAGAVAVAQDCKVPGRKCAEHGQCCGGCCVDGICLETYRNCYDSFDVCAEHVCVGEESCVPYSPPQCPGCEPVPVCII